MSHGTEKEQKTKGSPLVACVTYNFSLFVFVCTLHLQNIFLSTTFPRIYLRMYQKIQKSIKIWDAAFNAKCLVNLHFTHTKGNKIKTKRSDVYATVVTEIAETLTASSRLDLSFK